MASKGSAVTFFSAVFWVRLAPYVCCLCVYLFFTTIYKMDSPKKWPTYYIRVQLQSFHYRLCTVYLSFDIWRENSNSFVLWFLRRILLILWKSELFKCLELKFRFRKLFDETFFNILARKFKFFLVIWDSLESLCLDCWYFLKFHRRLLCQLVELRELRNCNQMKTKLNCPCNTIERVGKY